MVWFVNSTCRNASFHCVGEACPCTKKEFKCLTTDQCIPKEGRCNQTYECSDKSDERDCGKSLCQWERLCATLMLIHQSSERQNYVKIGFFTTKQQGRPPHLSARWQPPPTRTSSHFLHFFLLTFPLPLSFIVAFSLFFSVA